MNFEQIQSIINRHPEKLKVLVACEYSGRVRDALTALGHDAVSCDILPTESDGPHYHGDVMDILNLNWDLIIAFPPCTHLSAAGAPSWKAKQADGRQKEAFDFFMTIYNAPCSLVAVENPQGFMNTNFRKPCQTIQPYQFGEPVTKRTCLWLRGLPLLQHTDIVEPTHRHGSNSYRGGKRKDGTRAISKLPIKKAWDTGKERSLSFLGISSAMAAQWGEFAFKAKLNE